MEPSTRTFTLLHSRVHPYGGRMFGAERPSANLIDSADSKGLTSTAAPVPLARDFVLNGQLRLLPDNSLVQMVWSWRTAKDLGGLAPAGELRDNTCSMQDCAPGSALGKLLDACFGALNGSLGINSVDSPDRGQRYP